MRIAIGIEYDGTAYNGWQRQKVGTGVQEVVEAALAQVANHPVDVVCAGRTDTGVHASGQVAHFDTNADRAVRGWLLGANSNLPDDINLTWIQPVPDSFHARYSAESRTYRYLILNRLLRSSLFRNRAWWLHVPLNEARMQAAADLLIGEHDFSAFRAANCEAKTPVREIYRIEVLQAGDVIDLFFEGNGFLKHMVRNLAGTLIWVGRGKLTVDDARRILASRDRRQAGPTAQPQGLALIRVHYPGEERGPWPPARGPLG